MAKLTEEQKEARRITREANKKAKLIEKERLHKEQQLAYSLATAREFVNTRPMPPTIKYKIGQYVVLGCLDETIITDVLDGGRVLKVKTTNYAVRYGIKDKEPTICHRYVFWANVTYINEGQSVDREFSKEDDLRLTNRQVDIDSFIHTMQSCGYNDDTEYQRPHVWTLEDKVDLIRSIFNNTEIGKITLIARDSYKPYKYEVLDGKQRLNALMEFYESRFKYEGKYFYEMSRRDQNHFLGFGFVWSETENLTEKQKFEYFLRVNKTGKPQDAKHLAYVENLLSEM